MDRELWICGQLTGKYSGRGTPWEFQGVFSSEAKADAACRNENYFIYPVKLDFELPDDPLDPPMARYPRSVNAAIENGGSTQTLFCPQCGWRMDGEVGMKPECPDCGHRLDLLKGTREEIDKHIFGIALGERQI